MFGMLNSLAKAVVGVVIETPVAVVKDVATLGGSITREPHEGTYTMDSLKKVVDNISDATDPKK